MEKQAINMAELQEFLVEKRRYLHTVPELGTNTNITTKYVRENLQEMGYSVKEVGHNGLSACIGDGNGKTVLLRADMDGLPMKEEVDLEFKSTNENMHACGHDFHTAMLLGAAKVFKGMENEIHGTIKLMFQPAEETCLGAQVMIDAGILENPKVDCALAMHIFAGVPIPSNILLVPEEGPFSASASTFSINIQGKGGHGSMPHLCINPINVAVYIYQALQGIISGEINALDAAVISVGQIEAGNAFNIIPDTCMLKGTIRAFDDDVRLFIFKRIQEVSTAIAASFGATVDVETFHIAPSVEINKEINDVVFKELSSKMPKQVMRMKDLQKNPVMMGSEDFSFVTQLVPSTFLILCAGNSQEGYEYSVHNPKMILDESALLTGSMAFVRSGLALIKSDVLAEKHK